MNKKTSLNFYFIHKQAEDILIKFSSLSQVFLAHIAVCPSEETNAGPPGL